MVKNLSAMQESQIDSWVGKIPWRREWQPILVFLPRESYGQRSRVGYGLQGHEESDTKQLSMHEKANVSILSMLKVGWSEL